MQSSRFYRLRRWLARSYDDTSPLGKQGGFSMGVYKGQLRKGPDLVVDVAVKILMRGELLPRDSAI